METKFYVEINPITNNSGRDALNELQVSVDYDKGGYNYFNGNFERRGIYIHFKPIHRGGMFVSSWITGNIKENGFKVFVCELGRKSDKKIQYYASKIEPLLNNISKMYNEENYAGIYSLIKTNLI